MELFFVLIASILLAIVNQFHVITQWFTRPAGTYFTGIAHSAPDYFLYTDIMAQGASGTLWTAAHFTNEPMAKTWIYWFNALLGWLGNLIGLSPFGTYNVSLFLLVTLLCLLWYYFTKLLYPTNRLLRLTAWIMILTASSFSWNGQLLGQFWFSPAPAFNRLGGVPHQVFQTIVFLLLAISFNRRSLFMIPIAALAASANPIHMVLFIAAAIVLRAPRVIPLILVSVPVMFATNAAFDLPVLAAAKAWENAQYVSVSLWQFILSIGPIALLVPFGVKPFLKEKTPLRILLFSFSLLSIIVFFSPIPKLLGTTSVRWLSPAGYGVLGILAAEGLLRIKGKIIPTMPLYFLFFILYSVFTIPALATQIQARANTSELNYVPMTVIEVLVQLKVTGPGPVMEHSVVLTDPALPYDVLVPTFTGLPSFSGHPIHTLYPGVKEKLRRDYFAEKMTPDEQKQFLKDHRIRYVITKGNGSIKVSTYE